MFSIVLSIYLLIITWLLLCCQHPVKHYRLHCMKCGVQMKRDWLIQSLLLTEGVQAGQDLWVVIMVQTDAADQELFIYLPNHRAGAACLTFSHGDGHSKGVQGSLNLHIQNGRNRGKVRNALREQLNRVRRVYSLTLSMSTGKIWVIMLLAL